MLRRCRSDEWSVDDYPSFGGVVCYRITKLFYVCQYVTVLRQVSRRDEATQAKEQKEEEEEEAEAEAEAENKQIACATNCRRGE